MRGQWDRQRDGRISLHSPLGFKIEKPKNVPGKCWDLLTLVRSCYLNLVYVQH